MRRTPPNRRPAIALRSRSLFRRTEGSAARGRARWQRVLEPARAALRRSPRLTATIKTIVAIWTALVESFCASTDPYLSRFFPDLRLVATIDREGSLSLWSNVSQRGGEAHVINADDPVLRATAWTSVELRLRSDQVLNRTLTLPATSRAFLAPILENRLERLTPWKTDRVLFGYRVLEAPDVAATISVELIATSRDLVGSALGRLSDLGLVPTAIGADTTPVEEPLGLVLQSGGGPPRRPASRAIVSRTVLATLAILCLLSAFTEWRSSKADASRQDTSLRLATARRLLKNASLGAFGTHEKAMLAAKQPDRAMVVLVDRLAATIPQDTVLRELTVTQEKVRIAGRSANAPSLVGKLEATGLANVRFTAPVTREKDGKDSFELTADRPATEQATP